jgi:dihydrofolate reductase
VVGGRNTYDAAEAWGGQNPFGVPFFVLTHRPQDAPADAGFTFVDGLDEAVARAREAAGDRDVFVMGGADVIRQALAAGHLQELSISIAPVVLGGGKRLFEGYDETLRLEHLRLLQSPFATHISLKGAETCSCSVSVLMEETAEQVASMHSVLVLFANDRQAAGLIWRLWH